MKKCGLSVRYFLFVQFFFLLDQKNQNNVHENTSVISSASICRPSLEINKKRRSQLCFRNDARGDVYTLNRPSTHRNPSTTTHAKKELTTHEERESLKKQNKIPNILSMSERQFPLMYKIHCHFSTHLEKPQKQTKKKDNQNHVCILLHREALSVIRCVLLQAYSY